MGPAHHRATTQRSDKHKQLCLSPRRKHDNHIKGYAYHRVQIEVGPRFFTQKTHRVTGYIPCFQILSIYNTNTDIVQGRVNNGSIATRVLINAIVVITGTLETPRSILYYSELPCGICKLKKTTNQERQTKSTNSTKSTPCDQSRRETLAKARARAVPRAINVVLL